MHGFSKKSLNLFLWIFFQQDLHHWHIVFYISAAVYLAGNTFFLIFGSGVEQTWNKIDLEGLQEVSEVDGPRRVVGEILWLLSLSLSLLPGRLHSCYILVTLGLCLTFYLSSLSLFFSLPLSLLLGLLQSCYNLLTLLRSLTFSPFPLSLFLFSLSLNQIYTSPTTLLNGSVFKYLNRFWDKSH